MDKQKQIQTEELIGIIQGAVGGCATHWASLIAEEVLKYYQPKIPENAVVLTSEELEERDCKNHHEGYKTGVAGMQEQVEALNKALNEKNAELEEYVRKKTAEKFERLANERIAKEQGERDGYDTYRIDNKAKYDGDIVSFVLFEICKEITDKGVQNGN